MVKIGFPRRALVEKIRQVPRDEFSRKREILGANAVEVDGKEKPVEKPVVRASS